jgi:hypothetical protein
MIHLYCPEKNPATKNKKLSSTYLIFLSLHPDAKAANCEIRISVSEVSIWQSLRYKAARGQALFELK